MISDDENNIISDNQERRGDMTLNKMNSSDQKMISDNQERIENKIISANRESVRHLISDYQVASKTLQAINKQ